jgi:hypothetical protein
MPRCLRLACAIWLGANLLSACVAPATNDASAQDTTAKPPKMSRPLPPLQVREAPRIDASCRTDADCTVKNVGNCCGAMPACVNKDSPVDPSAVQSQCAKEDRVSACGFRQIDACSCNAGHCAAVGDHNPLRGPVLPPGREGH